MDANLNLRLRKIKEQIDALYLAQDKYLSLDAAKEHKLAVLISNAEGTSQSAKETSAKANIEWLEFKHSLAIAEALYHKQKHLLDLQNNAFQAEYLSAKVEYDLLKKGDK